MKWANYLQTNLDRRMTPSEKDCFDQYGLKIKSRFMGPDKLFDLYEDKSPSDLWALLQYVSSEETSFKDKMDTLWKEHNSLGKNRPLGLVDLIKNPISEELESIFFRWRTWSYRAEVIKTLLFMHSEGLNPDIPLEKKIVALNRPKQSKGKPFSYFQMAVGLILAYEELEKSDHLYSFSLGGISKEMNRIFSCPKDPIKEINSKFFKDVDTNGTELAISVYKKEFEKQKASDAHFEKRVNQFKFLAIRSLQ
jgi:hypothetical protein